MKIYIEDKIDIIMNELEENYPDIQNARWHAIKLLEKDKNVAARHPLDLGDVIDRSYEKDIINQKYDFIEEIISEVLVNKSQKEASTDKIDHYLTHRWLGLPIFLGIYGAGILSYIYHWRLAKRLFRDWA